MFSNFPFVPIPPLPSAITKKTIGSKSLISLHILRYYWLFTLFVPDVNDKIRKNFNKIKYIYYYVGGDETENK